MRSFPAKRRVCTKALEWDSECHSQEPAGKLVVLEVEDYSETC